MTVTPRWRFATVLVLLLALPVCLRASAYDAKPKLVILLVIDQVPTDLLQRQQSNFGPGGLRLFLEEGAFFTNCQFNYVHLRTAPGHATLGTGAYSNGHGILGNQWWDPARQLLAMAVQDAKTQVVGVAPAKEGSSPHNLLASTFGDEVRLATEGRARVFGVSFKDRAAVLAAGHSANAAYWIDQASGAWVSSTYYMSELPAWVKAFNSIEPAKNLNREWKDAKGKVLRSTSPGEEKNYYESVGPTGFGVEYTFQFARALVENEKLGAGPVTDVLTLSISSADILGHKVGSHSAQMTALLGDIDRQVAAFLQFLNQRLGAENYWVALSSDHGVAPSPELAARLHMPGGTQSSAQIKEALEQAVTRAMQSHSGVRRGPKISREPGTPRTEAAGGERPYIAAMVWPNFYLNQARFEGAGLSEEEAEELVAVELRKLPQARGAYGKYQLLNGPLPPNEFGRRMANSYSSNGGWWVNAIPRPWFVGGKSGSDHFSLHSYDTYVPVALLGTPFKPGIYRNACETVDVAPTLTSLLGVAPPSHSVGRVLVEALQAPGTAAPPPAKGAAR